MNKVIFSVILCFVLSNISFNAVADAKDDDRIKDMVEHALDDAAASDDIKIQVKNNVITLEGTTLTETSAALAEQTVRTAVKDEIGVTVKNNLNGIHD